MTLVSRPSLRPALIAALVAVALFALTLGGSYVYDDRFIANLDPRLHDVHEWSKYFTSAYFPKANDRLFRPVTSLSFAVEWLLHGDRPWVMHAVNVLLYALTCAGVAELARRLTRGSTRAALVAGLLFAAHPVHVEPVAYLVGRADLLATGATVAALLLFLHPRLTPLRALAIFACFVVAVGAKESGMLLPFILLAFASFRRHDLPAVPKPDEKAGLQTLVLLLTWSLAAYIVFREQSRVFKFSWDPVWTDWTMNPVVIASRVDRWLLPFSFLGRNTQLLFFPWRLNLDYSGWTAPAYFDAQEFPHFDLATDPFFYLGLLTVAAWWVAAVLAYRRRNRAVLACLVGLAVSYSMVSNFGSIIAANLGERLIFEPSVFLVILIAMALARLPVRALVPITAALLIPAAIRAETYAVLWNDPQRLYATCAAQQPSSARLKLLMMDYYMDQKDYAAAARLGAEARAASPHYWRTWYYSALAEAYLGHLDTAEHLLRHIDNMRYGGPGTSLPLLGSIHGGEFPSTNPSTRPTTAPAATTTRPASS